MFRLAVLVRSSGDRSSVAGAVAGVIHGAGPEIPIKEIRTVDQLVSKSLDRYRFALTLMVVFAGLGNALSIVGIYGVVSFSVGRRMREFGIRSATGARPVDLIRLVLGNGLVVCMIGLAGGLLLDGLASSLIRGVLFGVSPGDPAALAAAAAAIIALCIAAMLIPARRAGSADPASVLRDE